MFEPHHKPLMPWPLFLRRMVRYAAIGFTIIAVAWVIGIVGYAYFESMNLIDAMLNAAMILGGMGPVDPLRTNGGKIFAALYAMFSGVIFLVSIGVFAAPIFHRMLHQFHIDPDDDNDDDDDKPAPNSQP